MATKGNGLFLVYTGIDLQFEEVANGCLLRLMVGEEV